MMLPWTHFSQVKLYCDVVFLDIRFNSAESKTIDLCQKINKALNVAFIEKLLSEITCDSRSYVSLWAPT